MTPDIKTLQDTFKIGYEIYESSRQEGELVMELYHGRHYTAKQLNVLRDRQQPAEYFNVIKAYDRMLQGYFTQTISKIKINPRQVNDISLAGVYQDTVDYTLYVNRFKQQAKKIGGHLTQAGICCLYVNVIDTGKKDSFNKPIMDIKTEVVPPSEIVIDPLSKADDGSDSRFVHRFKWVDEETLKNKFPSKVKELTAYENHLGITEAEFTYKFTTNFTGKYRVYDNYLLVHSVIKDKNKTWSVYWCGDVILLKEEITFKKLKIPYIIVKAHESDKSEYYGIYRDIIESQNAINQALLQIQLMANTNRILAQKNAIDNIEEFKKKFNRINEILIVNNLQGIQIEKLNSDIVTQYNIIDRAIDRIQRVLGINDSFLGMAYASDSGKKVQLQQNASIVALSYIFDRMEFFYTAVGKALVSLIQQYYNANQILRVADEISGERWLEINKPLDVPTGRMFPNGTPEMRTLYQPSKNPENGEVEFKDGVMLMEPLIDPDTDMSYADFDLIVTTAPYNDSSDIDRVLMETTIQGPAGNALLQTSPPDYFKLVSIALSANKTRNSEIVAEIFNSVSQRLGGSQMVDPRMMAQMQSGGESNANTLAGAMGLIGGS